MIVVFDATLLLLIVDPDAKPPAPPAGISAKSVRTRIEYLLRQLEESAATALLPTPSLTEALGAAASIADTLPVLDKVSRFKKVPFDEIAAIECAMMLHRVAQGSKGKNKKSPWAKVKFDHQIVAIAKVHNAATIYSDDDDVKTLGRREGIEVIGLWELPLPPEDAQGKFDLGTQNPED